MLSLIPYRTSGGTTEYIGTFDIFQASVSRICIHAKIPKASSKSSDCIVVFWHQVCKEIRVKTLEPTKQNLMVVTKKPALILPKYCM